MGLTICPLPEFSGPQWMYAGAISGLSKHIDMYTAESVEDFSELRTIVDHSGRWVPSYLNGGF